MQKLEARIYELQEKLNDSERRFLLFRGDKERTDEMCNSYKAQNEELQKKLTGLEIEYNRTLDELKDRIEDFVNQRLKDEVKKAQDEWNKEKETKDRLIEAHRRHIQKLKSQLSEHESKENTGIVKSKSGETSSKAKGSDFNSDGSRSSDYNKDPSEV